MSSMYWKTEHKHKYGWDQVAKGFWKRYPNPNSEHVFSEDIISSSLEGPVLKTKRLIMKTNKLPSWGRHFFSARKVPVIEEAIIDASQKKIVTYTRNIGLRTFMGTTERATYSKDESDGSTRVIKEVWIESDIFGFRRAIQKFGIERFKSNCVKATEGFDFVLSQLFGEKLQ